MAVSPRCRGTGGFQSVEREPGPTPRSGSRPAPDYPSGRLLCTGRGGCGGTLAGKKPGAGREAEPQDLVFAEQGGSDMRPYERLIGAALDGQRMLFARQDTVEAAWRVVDLDREIRLAGRRAEISAHGHPGGSGARRRVSERVLATSAASPSRRGRWGLAPGTRSCWRCRLAVEPWAPRRRPPEALSE